MRHHEQQRQHGRDGSGAADCKREESSDIPPSFSILTPPKAVPSYSSNLLPSSSPSLFGHSRKLHADLHLLLHPRACSGRLGSTHLLCMYSMELREVPEHSPQAPTAVPHLLLLPAGRGRLRERGERLRCGGSKGETRSPRSMDSGHSPSPGPESSKVGLGDQ
eukprot:380977-Hanusia_phi.AAC.1